MTAPTLDPATLLRDLNWVRALARGLVDDPSTADDLAQETWVRALESPPRESPERPPRAWLATVLRNLVRERGRRAARRARREESAARSEGLPATDDLAARVELFRKLAREVLALEEPTRSTLLLRYVYDLEPTMIARNQQVPPATVRSRLKRGLEILRGRLDRLDEGGRNHWIAAFLPLIRNTGSTSVVPSIAGAGIVMKAASLAIAAIAAVVLGVVWHDHGDERQGERAADVAARDAAHASEAASRLRSVAAPRNTAEREPASVPVPVEAQVAGRVVDLDGTPLPGIEVFVGAERDPFPARVALPRSAHDSWHGRMVTTGDDGTFRASLAAHGVVELILRPSARYRASMQHDHAVLRHSARTPADGIEFVLVENAVAVLSVRVFDALANRYLDTFRLQVVGESLGLLSNWAREGEFRAELPLLTNGQETVVVTLTMPRHEPATQREVVLRPGEEREIVLAIQSEHLVRGRVTDRWGDPIPGALVFFGTMREALGDELLDPFAARRVSGVETDGDGRFELAGTGSHVSAWHDRHATETVEVHDAFLIELEERGSVSGIGAPRGELMLDEVPVATIEDGTFRLDDVDPRAHGLTFADRTSIGVRVNPGETTLVDLGARIPSVRLEVSAGGEPYRAPVRGMLMGLDATFTLDEFEGRGGTLVIENVLPGRYYALLGADGQGHVRIDGPTASLDLGDGALLIRTRPGARIALAPADVDELLRSVAARIALRADPDGIVRVSRIARGNWNVWDAKTGHTRSVEVGAETFDLDLRER